MLIQTFKNMRGQIYGLDTKRIECDVEGVLRIGGAEVTVEPESETIMPLLFNGSTGRYKATFTDKDGNEYDLGHIKVKAGRISPPRQLEAELMELRFRTEILEGENESLRQKIEELSNIFDTNALNFLIGGKTI